MFHNTLKSISNILIITVNIISSLNFSRLKGTVRNIDNITGIIYIHIFSKNAFRKQSTYFFLFKTLNGYIKNTPLDNSNIILLRGNRIYLNSCLKAILRKRFLYKLFYTCYNFNIKLCKRFIYKENYKKRLLKKNLFLNKIAKLTKEIKSV